MAGRLKMDTSEFETMATNISTENENIGDYLGVIKNTIINLNSWTGAAKQEAVSKINEFHEKTYVPYTNAVQGYIDFIRSAKTKYDQTESTLADAAKNIDTSALGKFSQ